MYLWALPNKPQPKVSHSSKGFTIIELLVVIVVIAILAAITLVAYAGITQRAVEASNVTAVDAYVQAFKLMAIDKKVPQQNLCLGPSGKYSGGTCSGWGQSGTVDSSWNTTLVAYGLTQQPNITGRTSSTATTIMYDYSFYGHPALLWGSIAASSCDQPNLISYNGSSYGLYGATYSSSDASGTACWEALDK